MMKGHGIEGLATFAWFKTEFYQDNRGICSKEVILQEFVYDHVIAMENNKILFYPGYDKQLPQRMILDR